MLRFHLIENEMIDGNFNKGIEFLPQAQIF